MEWKTRFGAGLGLSHFSRKLRKLLISSPNPLCLLPKIKLLTTVQTTPHSHPPNTHFSTNIKPWRGSVRGIASKEEK